MYCTVLLLLLLLLLLLIYLFIFIVFYIYYNILLPFKANVVNSLSQPTLCLVTDILVKHVIATVKVPDFDFCELQCYHQPNCVSINFNVIRVSKGLHECELNNATHRSYGNELLNRDGYIYKGADVRNRNILLSFTRKKKIQLHLRLFCVIVWQTYARPQIMQLLLRARIRVIVLKFGLTFALRIVMDSCACQIYARFSFVLV